MSIFLAAHLAGGGVCGLIYLPAPLITLLNVGLLVCVGEMSVSDQSVWSVIGATAAFQTSYLAMAIVRFTASTLLDARKKETIYCPQASPCVVEIQLFMKPRTRRT